MTAKQLIRENAEFPVTVAAFDTDHTIDYARGCVPLDHVTSLRDNPSVSVWSTGFNQSLRERAGVPGMRELKTKLGIDTEVFIDRPRRMELLERWIPDADRYFVVDDVDLTQLEPTWEYHTPWGYARDEIGLDIDADDLGRSRARQPWDPDEIPQWVLDQSAGGRRRGSERGD